jgi:hypothetical protein
MIRPKAINVEPQPDYCLLVTFSNNESGDYLNKWIYDFKRIFNNLPVLHIFGVEDVAICFQTLRYSEITCNVTV